MHPLMLIEGDSSWHWLGGARAGEGRKLEAGGQKSWRLRAGGQDGGRKLASNLHNAKSKTPPKLWLKAFWCSSESVICLFIRGMAQR